MKPDVLFSEESLEGEGAFVVQDDDFGAKPPIPEVVVKLRLCGHKGRREVIFEWDSDDCVAVPLIRYHDGLGAPAGSGREPTSLIRAEKTSQLDHLEEHFVGACVRYLLG